MITRAGVGARVISLAAVMARWVQVTVQLVGGEAFKIDQAGERARRGHGRREQCELSGPPTLEPGYWNQRPSVRHVTRCMQARGSLPPRLPVLFPSVPTYTKVGQYQRWYPDK